MADVYGYVDYEKNLTFFFAERAKRSLKYPEFFPTLVAYRNRNAKVLEHLLIDGFAQCPEFFNRTQTLALGNAAQGLFDAGTHIGRIRNHGAETIEKIQEGKFEYYDEKIWRDPTFPLHEKVSSIGIQEPLLNVPEVIPFAFSEKLVGLMGAYFEVLPVMSFAKLYYTFANQLPIADTQYFHFDGGGHRIIKVIVYLGDVGEGGGPFTYVRGSHLKKFADWDKKIRYTEAEMQEWYGSAAITPCYAKAGDIVIAETSGFHRGEKPLTANRKALILTYCAHPEYGFDYKPMRVKKSTLTALTPMLRSTADCLAAVD